ncbi:MAG TPA: hypothetical protein VIJ35_03410 [Bradyrhizobium sp.]|jgi:hypothetical protein
MDKPLPAQVHLDLDQNDGRKESNQTAINSNRERGASGALLFVRAAASIRAGIKRAI